MPSNTDHIFIKDLELDMFTGIYEKEKQNAQRVIINIDIEVQSNKGKTLSGIKDVLSYEDITNEIQSLSKSRHFELLEEFCEEISAICLKDSKALNVMIRAEKPDIIENTSSVGVYIRRTQNT
tara:strand:- start:279 stop:647 length:369 start_codon:yes stop_codon:yes gene_type:complete